MTTTLDYAAKLSDPEFLLHGPSGCSCIAVIDFENGWGAKVYQHQYYRDKQYNNQTDAAEYNLGPNIGPSFQFTRHGEKYYAFLTEIVETLDDDMGWSDGDYWTEEGEEKLCELRNNLYNKIDYDFNDDWPPNCGIKNGELICIDFG